MKKFFICLAILGIFGIFVFAVGWTSIRVKPEYTGVVISKTGGVNQTPVVNGKFSWHKEFLLPTNAVLKTFEIEPLSVTKTVTGRLASGDIYASSFGSSENFGYEFTYSMYLSLAPEDLITLVTANKIKTNDDLKAYLENCGDIIAQLTTEYLLKKVEDNSRFDVNSIRRDDLTKSLRIYQECPDVELSLFAITSSKVPDYDLYKKVRNQVFTSNYSANYTSNNSAPAAETDSPADVIEQEN